MFYAAQRLSLACIEATGPSGKEPRAGLWGPQILRFGYLSTALGSLARSFKAPVYSSRCIPALTRTVRDNCCALAICCVDRGQTFETSCGSRRRRSAAYWIHHQIVDGDPIRRRTRTSIQAPLVSAMSRRCLGIQAVNCLLQKRRLHPSRSWGRRGKQ